MFSRHFLTTIKHLQTRFNTNIASDQKKWDVLCGVCLERKPVISRPKNHIEIAFSKILAEIELENSMKCDHEIRYKADQRRAQEFKKGKISTDDIDKALGQTAAEFEDSSKAEFAKFIPASRITEADKKNDVKSLDRKLDQHLLYLVNETIGKENYWLLPQDKVRDNESLRTAAERILLEKYGSKIRVKFLTNLPCGVYVYKYSSFLREKLHSTGMKVFFMKAQYLNGEVEGKTDFVWATRSELKEKLPRKYKATVETFLIEDEPVNIKY